MVDDFSLGPQRRIKKRKDFLRIQSSGRKLRSKHFLVVSSPPIRERTESRIGVTITTKVDKRAVKRNQLRRRIRELFRKFRVQLREPKDLVVIALNGATELSYGDIHQELKNSLLRGKLINRCEPAGSCYERAASNRGTAAKPDQLRRTGEKE